MMCCRMFDHAIVIVHTHSDDSTGDLWFTTYDSELQGPAAMQIGDVRAYISVPTHAH